MSDAELDPHVLVSARLRDNPKVIHLSSDTARWAWVVLLGEAKLQRPAGRFATRRVVDHLMGAYRRYVAEFIQVGLIEVDGDSLVVHDWPKHQDRRSRVQVWRDSVGLTSGRETLRDGSGNDRETVGETTGKQPGNNREGFPLARAPVHALQSQSQSTLDSGPRAREDDPEGPVIIWLAQHGCAIRPGDGYHQRLVPAVERHGTEPILSMMERLAKAGTRRGDIKGFLFGAIDALDAATRPKLADVQREEREAERGRVSQSKVDRTKIRAHDNGFHADEPDRLCPRCQAA